MGLHAMYDDAKRRPNVPAPRRDWVVAFTCDGTADRYYFATLADAELSAAQLRADGFADARVVPQRKEL